MLYSLCYLFRFTFFLLFRTAPLSLVQEVYSHCYLETLLPLFRAAFLSCLKWILFFLFKVSHCSFVQNSPFFSYLQLLYFLLLKIAPCLAFFCLRYLVYSRSELLVFLLFRICFLSFTAVPLVQNCSFSSCLYSLLFSLLNSRDIHFPEQRFRSLFFRRFRSLFFCRLRSLFFSCLDAFPFSLYKISRFSLFQNCPFFSYLRSLTFLQNRLQASTKDPEASREVAVRDAFRRRRAETPDGPEPGADPGPTGGGLRRSEAANNGR